MRRRITRTITVALTLTATSAFATMPASAISTKPRIVTAAITPKIITSPGRPATLTATVANAVSCSISTSPAVLSGAGPIGCDNISQTIYFPSNTTRKKVLYKITLTITGSTGTKTKTLTAKVNPGAGGPSAPLANATQITAGAGHTCALLADHTIQCWGGNGYGQLGNGTTTNSATPVTVIA